MCGYRLSARGDTESARSWQWTRFGISHSCDCGIHLRFEPNRHSRGSRAVTSSTGDPADDPEADLRERFFHADLDREPGDRNREWVGITAHPIVFPVALLIIATFVLLTISLGNQAAAWYGTAFDFVNANFGWLFVLAVNVYLVGLVGFAISRYGTIRIGGPDAKPEFSVAAWLAMLFSSGMGVGLLFFGVAEPTQHLLSGGGSFFDVAPNSPASGRAATALTMFHWGFHPWGIYGMVGLGLAFFSFNRGLPLGFRSMFYPLLGERIYDWPGHVIDLAAIIATLFGLATATGLAALQITAGLDFVATNYASTSLPTDVWMTVGIIAVLIGVTTLSAWAGLENGIKRLSTVNVGLMVTLLLFVFVVGPTVYLLDVFNSGLAAYLGNFLELSFFGEAFAGDRAGWQHAYTIFYWGFWITWAPFVGIFIARISKGRTIRQFVAAVLLVPVAFSLLWMAAFNGSAIFVELNVLSGGISDPLQNQGRAVALFEMLSFYPLTLLTSLIVTVNLVTFLVTSTDSGSLVASFLATGGSREPGTRQRVLWPIVIGLTATALLVGDGLSALKTAVITTGLPFAVVILLLVYTLYRGLQRELEIQESDAYQAALDEQSDATSADGGSMESPSGQDE
jgi:choline/carnitine/betaine transport